MSDLRLTVAEQAMLDGAEGPGVAMAMRVVTALARVRRAHRLVEIRAAHVDSCLYHGRAGLDFAERLVALGAQVKVPTTLNVGSLDLLHPGTVHDDSRHPDVLTGGRALMNAYTALGASPTWTCAPYQVGARPRFGEHVAWAESNAIVFANSVLGARTDRYGDFLDVCAAVTGRAPLAGLHLDSERMATLVVDVRAVSRERLADTLWWGLLGHRVGQLAAGRLPALIGLPPDPGEDALKALGAAAASSGAVGMFHAVGITPEAADLASCTTADAARLSVDDADLDAVRAELRTSAADRLDAVSLGTPHASLTELGALARELERAGATVASGVDAVVTTSRGVLEVARAAGLVAMIEAAGFRIVVDTCTYITPVFGAGVRVVMTNSGKWAHYAPGNIGVAVVPGTLAECVASACAGRVVLHG